MELYVYKLLHRKGSGRHHHALHMIYKLSLRQHDKCPLVNETIIIKNYTSMKYYA